MHDASPGTKWCHVSLSTYKRRKVFNIAETARFCEHLLRRTCKEEGWQVAAISVRPDAVHTLLEVPSALPRDHIVRRLRTAAAVHDSVYGCGEQEKCPGGRRVFETGHWFAVLRGGARVAAIRRHLLNQAGVLIENVDDQ
jgi:REP element-mobilizing transposase RayT